MTKKARDYQSDTERKVLKNYDEGKRRNLIVLATGLGKTFLATNIHKSFQKRSNKKTLFLVDRIELAYQARDAFLSSDPNLRVGIEMNENKSNKHDDVVIACTHTIGRKGSFRIGKLDPDDFSLVFVDEAHGSVTDTTIRILSHLGVGPKSKIGDKLLIGLTATPNRPDGRGLGEIYHDVVVNYDIRYGISQGWLTSIELIQVSTGVDINGLDWNESKLSELSKAINIPTRNAQIVKTYLEVSKNEPALAFCTNVEHAYSLSETFKTNGINSECIEANTPPELRKEYISQYKGGKIKVLTCFGTLTTGLDAPETTTILLARPVKSSLLLTQIIGRGLRTSAYAFIDAAVGAEQRKKLISLSIKPRCKVIDFHDIVEENKIVTVPSLFGFNNKLKTKSHVQDFFKEVVEPLDELQHEQQVNIDNIVDIDDVPMIVQTRKMEFESLKTPEFLQDLSDKAWLETKDGHYELAFPKERKSLIVVRTLVDDYDLLEYNSRTKLTRKLNNFNSLTGAISIADKYADKTYDTTFSDISELYNKGVTRKQREFLIRLFKGGIRVDKYDVYSDTKEPVIYYRKTGERLNAGTASNLIKIRTKQ